MRIQIKKLSRLRKKRLLQDAKAVKNPTQSLSSLPKNHLQFVPLPAMEKNRFNYPKHEKLKSTKTIDLLFTEGKSVSKYPLRLVYVPIDLPEGEKIKMGISVSKKYFKKAVDRNYFKRVLRETYRHNKHILLGNSTTFAFMFFYQTKEKLSFEEINTKTIQLFEKFIAHEQP